MDPYRSETHTARTARLGATPGSRGRRLLAPALALTVLAASGTSQTVVNGDMDGTADFSLFNGVTPPGWTGTWMGCDLLDVTSTFVNQVWLPSSGGGPFVHGVGFNGLEWIAQQVSGLAVGAQYTVSFEQSITNSDFTTHDSGFWQVDFGPDTLDSTLMITPPLGVGVPWQPQALTFTASATTQELRFTARKGTPLPPGLRSDLGVDTVSILLTAPPPSCLLGLDLADNLWNVSASTGAGSFPRSTGITRYGGLAKSPSGTLYALRESPLEELHVIDELTGAVTIVGPLGIEVELGGLDFDPISGELYGVGGSTLPGVDSELFTVDTVTGAATLVGPVVDQSGNRIFASALAFDLAGNLFVLKANSAPPEIYHVNPLDGSVFDRVPLPSVGTSFDGGMDFDDFSGYLYLTHAGELYRVNPYTGASIPMGPTPASMALEVDGTCGLVVVPVPVGTVRPVSPTVFRW